MSLLKGLEGLSARMEDEQEATPVTEETTVDVEVRVAEEVEAEVETTEASTAIVEDAESSDDAVEEIEALESFIASIEKYGLTQQGLELMNHKGALAAFSGHVLPAVESLDAVGRNHEAAQATMEALKDSIGRGWEAIKKFFKSIWDRVKGWVAAIINKLSFMETAVKRSLASVKGVEMDSAKADAKKVKFLNVTNFASLAQATKSVCNDINSLKPAQADNANYVKTSFGDGGKNLSDIGITLSDNTVKLSDKGLKVTEAVTLSSTKWNAKACEDKYAAVQAVTAEMRKLSGFGSAFGKMCEVGISEINSLTKSNTEKVDPSEKIKIIRSNVSLVSQIATKAITRALAIPRMYIGICAAVRSCAAGAAPADKKEEKE